MDLDEVPQDQTTTWDGQLRVMYAVDKNGEYTTATSTGWDAEEYANKHAASDLAEDTLAAWHLVEAGEKSPIYFYMHYYRYDVVSLAQATGLFRWRVRRHIQPQHFQKLPTPVLLRYAAAFKLSIEQLQKIPPRHE